MTGYVLTKMSRKHARIKIISAARYVSDNELERFALVEIGAQRRGREQSRGQERDRAERPPTQATTRYAAETHLQGNPACAGENRALSDIVGAPNCILGIVPLLGQEGIIFRRRCRRVLDDRQYWGVDGPLCALIAAFQFWHFHLLLSFAKLVSPPVDAGARAPSALRNPNAIVLGSAGGTPYGRSHHHQEAR
jgi:hypothetical protein